MTIEMSYNLAKKSPTAIAVNLQNLWMQGQAASKINPLPLSNGVHVDLAKIGYSLDFKLRKEFAAAAKILHKKKLFVFLLGVHDCVIFKGSPSNLKKVAKTNTSANPQTAPNKVFGFPINELFAHYAIKKGGKSAFYNFLRNLNKKNTIVTNPEAVGAIMYKHIVPTVHLKAGTVTVQPVKSPHPMVKEPKIEKIHDGGVGLKKQEEVEEPKIEETKIEVPKVTIKLPPTKTILPKHSKLKKFTVDGNSASELKSKVAKTLSKDKELLKAFNGDVDKAEAFANTSVKDWAGSAVGYGSTWLQAAVANMAKLKPHKSFLKHSKIKLKKGSYYPAKTKMKEYEFKKYSSSYSKQKELPLYTVDKERLLAYKTILARAVYEKTQAFLKKQGVKELLLFRGMGENSKLKQFSYTYKTINIALNPLSSFSTKLIEATSFGDNIIAAIVPRERIFSCAATGHGCWGEEEVIVIGGLLKGIGIHLDDNISVKQVTKEIIDVLKGKPLKETSAPEDDVYADEGDNANWTKTTLDGRPLIGTLEFQSYLQKSNKTVDQILARMPYRLAHIRFLPVLSWLKRMAVTLDAANAVFKVKPIDQIKASLCHLATVRGIANRLNKSDKIWFFGDNDGKHPQVFHSLLTDKKNKVVANNYQGVGSLPTQFDPKLGYKTPAGEYLPVLDKVNVGEFFEKFFTS